MRTPSSKKHGGSTMPLTIEVPTMVRGCQSRRTEGLEAPRLEIFVKGAPQSRARQLLQLRLGRIARISSVSHQNSVQSTKLQLVPVVFHHPVDRGTWPPAPGDPLTPTSKQPQLLHHAARALPNSLLVTEATMTT